MMLHNKGRAGPGWRRPRVGRQTPQSQPRQGQQGRQGPGRHAAARPRICLPRGGLLAWPSRPTACLACHELGRTGATRVRKDVTDAEIISLIRDFTNNS